MSVQTQIDRLKTNVENSFVAVAAKGGTVPENQNSDNLPDAIMGIPVNSEGSNYQISITFASAFLGQPYTVTGPEEETHTGVVPDSLQDTVQVYHGGSEYTVRLTDSNANAYSATVLVGTLFGTYSVALVVSHIYGVTWDGTSTTKWTRTDGAADFTDPVPYVAGAKNYRSPFDYIMPWAGMTTEERAGGTMVKIPKFWYQLTQNTEGTPSSGITIKIANEPVEGFSVSPAHMDRGDGHGERDIVYVGRYHCASDYKSKTGVLPITAITRATARTGIHNLGSNIWQFDFAARLTIWLLYLVEFADWNSQACIGYGCGNGNSANMGYTDSMPYHTGTILNSRSTAGASTQYRYIEGLWDNGLDWLDGIFNDSNGQNIILNPQNYSDNSGGILIGNSGEGVLYPSVFRITNIAGFPLLFPEERNGSASTYSCDAWGCAAKYPLVFSGGSFSTARDIDGLFSISYTGSGERGIVCRNQEL